MHEFKEGKLKSSSGDKVTKRNQAIAIAISEAKEANLKVPSQESPASKKKIESVNCIILLNNYVTLIRIDGNILRKYKN